MSRIPAYPRSTALRSGSEGRRLFGGRKESSPQLRAPPRSFGVRPRTTPFLVFKIAFVVSLPLRIFVLQDYGGAHPLVMDALAEMSEAQMQMRLTHPPVRAQYPRRGKRGDGWDAPFTQNLFSYAQQ